MRKIHSLVILLFFLSVSGLYAQVEAGLGIAKVTFKENTVLNFYAEKEGTEILKTIEFVTDPSSQKVTIKGYELVADWLKPEEINFDQEYVAFRCIFVKEGWIKVMANEKDNYWIKRDDAVDYKDWEIVFAQASGVSRMEEYPQKVREAASDNASNLKYEGTDCFEVKTVKGDWLEVSATGNCDGTKGDANLESGWIRWKKSNRIIIRYYVQGD